MKRIQSILDFKMTFAQIDWSDKNLLKTVFVAIGTAIANFLHYSQVAPVLIKMLVVAMVLDTLMGARVARKIKKEYSSKVLRGGVYEKGLYLAVFLALAYFLKGLKVDYEWLPTTLFSLLLGAETISLIGHMISLRTGKIEPERDLLTIVLKALKGLLQYFFDGLIDKLKDFGSKKKPKDEQ